MITSKYSTNPKVTAATYTETEEGVVDPILKKKGVTNSLYNTPKAGEIDKPKVQVEQQDTAPLDTAKGVTADLSAGTIASGAMQAIGSVYARESQEPLNRKARNASTLSMTAQGASIGTSILPGWGTVIGAAAGAIYGGVKGISDAKKIAKKARREKIEAFNKVKQEREEAQRQADGSYGALIPGVPKVNPGIYSNYKKQ